MIQKLMAQNLATVYLDSKEYKDFLINLEQKKEDINFCVCLTCWRFVNMFQKKVHELKGHHCLEAGTFNSEAAFLHYNKVFMQSYQRKIVTLFANHYYMKHNLVN